VFGCAVLTGVGAVVNTAALPRGASVAVLGLGGVGLAALLGARRLEAAPLVAIDLSAEKLALARALGATHTFNAADPDCAAQVREATRGGVDFAFEMAGAVPALELAWNITARGGTTVTAGLPHPERVFGLRPVVLVGEERTLKGSYLGGATPSRDIPRYIEWFRRGELPIDRLLSERIALADINAAFDRLADGQTVRQVIVFD
jgi:alcohol dehydrogenase